MVETICPRCGKRFIRAPLHIYKDEKGFYCSWTCYNHKKDRGRVVEQYTKYGEIKRTFTSATNAAETIGGTAEGIRIACRKCTFYKGYLWRYKE